MKKLIISLAALALLLPMAFASAKTEGSASVHASSNIKLGPVIKAINRDAKHASTTFKTRVEAIHKAIDEHKDRIEKRADRWGEKVLKHVRKIIERLERAVDKFENISARLDSRIEKLQAEGFATASSSALLIEANADIAVANEKVLAVSAAFDAALGTTTPKAHLGNIRAAVSAAQEALKEAKRSLTEVIRSIKVELRARGEVE